MAEHKDMRAIEEAKAMPGDATHVAWGQRVAFMASVVMYASGIELLHIIGMVAVFMFGVKYVSPDLDIQSIPYQRWGILRVLWWPFLKIIPHRSKWSHHIILGPIGVVSYFVLMMICVCVILDKYWLPVVEPMIDDAQDILKQIVTLNLTPDNAVFVDMSVLCLLVAAEWHVIMDIVMKGDRQG